MPNFHAPEAGADQKLFSHFAKDGTPRFKTTAEREAARIELWRIIPIDSLGGKYEASSLGNVRSWLGSKEGQTPSVLIGSKHPCNTKRWGAVNRIYLTLTHSDGHISQHSRASLVMLAFEGPGPEGMEICHYDGNPSNDSRVNLRYDTHKRNLTDNKFNNSSETVRMVDLTEEEWLARST